MEVKSKEQKTFTYTLTINSSEVDELLGNLMYRREEIDCPKLYSLESKLREVRNADLANE